MCILFLQFTPCICNFPRNAPVPVYLLYHLLTAAVFTRKSRGVMAVLEAFTEMKRFQCVSGPCNSLFRKLCNFPGNLPVRFPIPATLIGGHLGAFPDKSLNGDVQMANRISDAKNYPRINEHAFVTAGNANNRDCCHISANLFLFSNNTFQGSRKLFAIITNTRSHFSTRIYVSRKNIMLCLFGPRHIP